jgi:hypothetical protein
MIGIEHYVVVSAILFVLGVLGTIFIMSTPSEVPTAPPAVAETAEPAPQMRSADPTPRPTVEASPAPAPAAVQGPGPEQREAPGQPRSVPADPSDRAAPFHRRACSGGRRPAD